MSTSISLMGERKVKTVRWICWTQLIIGLIMFIAEVLKVSLNATLGTVTMEHTIIGSGLVILAVWAMFVTVHQMTIQKLYMAMTLHIINGVIQVSLLNKIFSMEIPIFREELNWEYKIDTYQDREFELMKCKYTDVNCIHRYRENLHMRSIEGLRYYNRLLTLIGIISISSLSEAILSSKMVLMSGCAIWQDARG